jgi:hypothetical protein
MVDTSSCPVASAIVSASAAEGLGLYSNRNDVHGLATALGTELDCAGGECEQGVVAATADVDAGVEVRATLTNQDLACAYGLAAETLDAEALSIRVATVTGA